MALALDASSPAGVDKGTGGTLTTASFTAPSGAVLVAFVMSEGETAGAGAPVPTVSDSGSLTWTKRAQMKKGDTGAQNGGTWIYTAVTSSSVARTVSVSFTGTNIASYGLKIDVWTGADTTTVIGATGQGSTTSQHITPTVLTTTAANSWVMGCWEDENAGNVAPTTTDSQDYGFHIVGNFASLTGEAVKKSAATATSGTAVTLDFNSNIATGNSINWCAIELLVASSGGTPVSSSDSATESELVNGIALTGPSDSGAESEANAIASALSATDSSSLTDTLLAIALAYADSGSVSELVNGIALAISDSATESETTTLAVGILTTDSATGTETNVLSAALSFLDSGVFSDTTLTIALGTTDSGGLSEAFLISIPVSATDTLTLSEAALIAQTFAGNDTIVVVETQSILIFTIYNPKGHPFAGRPYGRQRSQFGSGTGTSGRGRGHTTSGGAQGKPYTGGPEHTVD